MTARLRTTKRRVLALLQEAREKDQLIAQTGNRDLIARLATELNMVSDMDTVREAVLDLKRTKEVVITGSDAWPLTIALPKEKSLAQQLAEAKKLLTERDAEIEELKTKLYSAKRRAEVAEGQVAGLQSRISELAAVLSEVRQISARIEMGIGSQS